MTTTSAATQVLKKKDFESDQEIRWCPGCGDYSILATLQRYMAKSGKTPENTVVVSGIGCSSRFPYYMNTYGVHSVHGRAPAVATGVKLANPNLDVWIITGDGDALSIGGNHFVHLLRRNLDLNIVLFNNRIYGLTKGQYSPTSEHLKITKSSPYGSPEQPLNPALLALGSRSTFVARCLDVDAKLMLNVFEAADKHNGTAFIEVYQNCLIFNDGAFDSIREREHRAETMLVVEDGKPLVFGAKKNKGIHIEHGDATVIEFNPENDNAAIEAGVTVYKTSDPQLASAMARLPAPPEFPVPVGVLYEVSGPTYEGVLAEQAEKAMAKHPISENTDEALSELFNSGDTWEIS